ncbi:MAG: ABC transporter permease [Helicobacteraceae bacterium]|nr:ABC transporter permease [Helicobacteraceae bacterium]
MTLLKHFFFFLSHIFDNHRLIATLIMHDFKRHYLGSYFGLFWAFFQPIVFIAVIWFVFEIGLKAQGATNDTPFALWLICGMVPWFFFVNGLSSGTNAIISNAYLIKKVTFRVSILPLVQIGSALLIHLVLVVLMMGVALLYGFTPTLYWLQLFYYLGCMIVLLLAITWLTSSLRVFIKDIGNMIAVIVQIGFWATPIFWSLELIPQEYRKVIELNPIYYIIEGYRDSLFQNVWFWEKDLLTLYFIVTSVLTLVLGAFVFKKLRPHFGDVL